MRCCREPEKQCGWPEFCCLHEIVQPDETNARIVACFDCGTEGKLYIGQYEDECYVCDCPSCEGTGGEIVETEPVTLADMDEFYGGLNGG